MPATLLPPAAFLAAWAFLAMNVLTPGPNVLNTIALAIGSGRRAALGAALGTGLSITLWCLGMVLGVAALLVTVPATRLVMTLVATGLLIWFASRYLRRAASGLAARRRGEAPAPEAKRGLSARAGMLRAMSIMLMNPKALTTWLTMTAVFPVDRAGPWDVAILCVGACVVAGAIHAAYAVAFSTPAAGRAFMRAAPWINLGVGLFFAGFAATLAGTLLRHI
ncbi:LysE family translocator [Pararhodobacter zhoushanensis]|uniref:LysE family transporter n=1 Tax=Pararhodobacter zhoushanensis TaxID=2479545 RepID=A0ABT3GTI2_9RHOB|nr:LysE family transporter [Pararhodobacter zhoushanensis]MCW1930856.1 LysE family transporter [Pararhodobacter zhoushanensis]